MVPNLAHTLSRLYSSRYGIYGMVWYHSLHRVSSRPVSPRPAFSHDNRRGRLSRSLAIFFPMLIITFIMLTSFGYNRVSLSSKSRAFECSLSMEICYFSCGE